MFRLNLGGGAVAFEIEGEADRVGSPDPSELIQQKWPPEVVENYRRYRMRSKAAAKSPAATAGSSTFGEETPG